MFSLRKPFLLAVALIAFVGARTHADVPLRAQKPIVLPGGAGGFDWMIVEEAAHRLFATHKGAKTLVVVDLRTEKIAPIAAVGTVQSVAVDRKDNKIFLGDDEEHKVVVLDYATLKKAGDILVTGPVDDLLYCPKNGLLYADHDDGEDVWVIDAKTQKLVTTIKVPAAPEKVEYDALSGRIYQNIKSNDTLLVIDPATNKVVQTFRTAPAAGPHGLVIDAKTQRLFSAGSNGKLVVMDMKSGKVTATVDIAKGVDQIAYDKGNQRIYCACQGAISVVQVTLGGATLLGNVSTPRGAHTLTVDSATHAVWTCYADAHDSYLLKLVP